MGTQDLRNWFGLKRKKPVYLPFVGELRKGKMSSEEGGQQRPWLLYNAH